MSTSPRLITPIPGPKSLALAGKLRQVESPNVTYTSDRFPVFWESAQGCAVTDVDGNVFLDMTAAFGVSSVGHAHPDVVAAVQAQAGKLLHGMGDVHPAAIKVALCERIASRVPIPNAQVILSQNGSDAVESALKTAVLATGKPGVIAFEGGYHGLSYGALNATSRPDFRAPFLSQMGRFISHLPFGCAPEMIDDEMAAGEIGAVLVEPIQGRGGINVPPPGWLADIHRVCRRHGALLILDEIFTGWARTGNWFACEYEYVIPDILCIGKAMGGGLPISACVAAKATMAAWPVSRGEALHTSTFLGNPLACAASLAAIDVLEREELPARAVHIGAYFERKLREMQDRHPKAIREVRGRGLMLGVEFDSSDRVMALIEQSLQQGLILLPAGNGEILEFVPPLIITESEIDLCLEILGKILTSLNVT